VRAALRGQPTDRLVAGGSWIPESVAEACAPGIPTPAGRLAAVAADAGLDFVFVPAGEPWATEAVDRLAASGVAALWAVDGPLWPVMRSRGFARAIALMQRDPDVLADDLIAELSRTRRAAEAGLAAGAAAIVIADDLSGAEGPIVAPDFAITAAVPGLAAIVETVAGFDVPTVFHSDGDFRFALNAVARAGFDAVHGASGVDPDDRRMTDLVADVRGRDLTFVGGISAAELDGSPMDAVRAGTRAGLLADAGRFVPCDDGGIAAASHIATLTEAIAAARL
jgi:hypothetical protein